MPGSTLNIRFKTKFLSAKGLNYPIKIPTLICKEKNANFEELSARFSNIVKNRHFIRKECDQLN